MIDPNCALKAGFESLPSVPSSRPSPLLASAKSESPWTIKRELQQNLSIGNERTALGMEQAKVRPKFDHVAGQICVRSIALEESPEMCTTPRQNYMCAANQKVHLLVGHSPDHH